MHLENEYKLYGKVHKYFPDFILEDGTYIEIKGYSTLQFEAKSSGFNKKLEIIDKYKIKMYLDYVLEKYGKGFISLYEKK